MAFHIPEFRNTALGQAQYGMMVNARKAHEAKEKRDFQVNSALTQRAWVDIDRAVVGLRDQVHGIEIVDYLDGVTRATPLGKYALEYSMAGDIDQSIAVDLEGATPITYDHTAYDSDGDPIPVFHGGFGVSARQQASLQTLDINLMLDSERVKIQAFHREIVNYTLRGNSNIRIGQYAGQGLLNHRNTYKIDLGASGVNVDLTTATPAQLEAFFQNVFSQAIDDNELGFVTKWFVSPEIYRNLTKSWAIATSGDGQGSVLDRLIDYMGVRGGKDAIQMTYALSGNEFLAINLDRQYVEKPVGQGMIVLPRTRENFLSPQNADIYAAQGVSVKRDFKGRSGVIYGGVNA